MLVLCNMYINKIKNVFKYVFFFIKKFMGIIKIKLVFNLLFYICLKIYEIKMGIKIYKLKIKL